MRETEFGTAETKSDAIWISDGDPTTAFCLLMLLNARSKVGSKVG